MVVASWVRSVIVGAALLLVGCDVESLIIKDEVSEAIDEGEVVAEMRGQVITADLVAEADGSGRLVFRFVYLLGVVDPEGIARVEWRYRLLHPDRRELAARRDTMREAFPDRTAVLVHSDEMGKGRSLRFNPGALAAGERYVLWITAFYRGDILHETLVAIDEGVPYVDPIDPAQLPELLNSF